MLSPTTRTMLVTYFDVVCVDSDKQEVTHVPCHMFGIITDTSVILKKVKKKGLGSPNLIPRRITNLKHVIELRSMDANKFFELAKPKKETIYEGFKN